MSIVCYSPQNCNPNNYGFSMFNANIGMLKTVYEICEKNRYETYYIHNKRSSLFLPKEIEIMFTIAGLPNWFFDRDNYLEALKRSRCVIWIIDGAETEKISGGSALDKRFCSVNKNNIFTYHFYYEKCKHKPAIHFPWGFFNDFCPRFERINPSIDGIFYHGNYRKERIDSFKRFFSHKSYPTYIITGSKHAEKFRDLGLKALYFERMPFYKLRLFASTLYIIDDDLQNVNIPTARYFEAISLGVLPFIDERAIDNFQDLDGAYSEDQIVYGYKDLNQKLKYVKDIRKKFLRLHEYTNYYLHAKNKLIELIEDNYEN